MSPREGNSKTYDSPILDPPDAERLELLRTERLARLQGSMRAHDVAACLLFNEPNIRYATGASAMPVYAMSTFVRCAVVPQEGQPILFEHANSVHRSRRRAPDVRPMHAWEFFDDPVADAAWRAATTDRRVAVGDLVYVGTDSVALEGCFFCVSRTFAVGEPRAAQRATYRAAQSWLSSMEALVRRGLTCGELAAMAPPIPERFMAQRYECMIHGIGLDEENPSVCHPLDAQSNAESVLESGMVLVVEGYFGGLAG